MKKKRSWLRPTRRYYIHEKYAGCSEDYNLYIYIYIYLFNIAGISLIIFIHGGFISMKNIVDVLMIMVGSV